MNDQRKYTHVRLVPTGRDCVNPYPGTNCQDVWAAHQQALAIGRLIESHHARLVALARPGHAPSSADLGEIHDYLNDLARARACIDTLGARLAALLQGASTEHGA